MNRDAIAKAIYDLNPTIQPWNGDPYSFEEVWVFSNDHHLHLAYLQADAAIESLTAKG